jgi:hypothetical protein
MTRRYISPSQLISIAEALTPRERAILNTLANVRLASADQLERLHFVSDTARSRRRILLSLTDRGLATRLDRVVGGQRAGSSGFVYGLGDVGQRVLAQAQGWPRRRPTEPGAPFRRHCLAITELFVRLTEATRTADAELLEFSAEPLAWRRYLGRGGARAILKPDAFVRIGVGDFIDSWFIEVDLATESPSTLKTKLDAYRAYWATGKESAQHGVHPRTLWLAPDERRAQVIIDCCGRQPSESWQLHQVTLFDGAIGTLIGGES